VVAVDYIDQILQHQLLVVQEAAMLAEAVAVMLWQTTPQDRDFQAVLQQDSVLLLLKTKAAQVVVVPAEKDLIPVLQVRLHRQLNMPQYLATVDRDWHSVSVVHHAGMQVAAVEHLDQLAHCQTVWAVWAEPEVVAMVEELLRAAK
jgi:hypothetical protein